MRSNSDSGRASSPVGRSDREAGFRSLEADGEESQGCDHDHVIIMHGFAIGSQVLSSVRCRSASGPRSRSGAKDRLAGTGLFRLWT